MPKPLGDSLKMHGQILEAADQLHRGETLEAGISGVKGIGTIADAIESPVSRILKGGGTMGELFRDGKEVVEVHEQSLEQAESLTSQGGHVLNFIDEKIAN